MNIVIVHNSKIPALKYGGIERVIWYLGYELVQLGHKVTFLVKEYSYCPFAKVLILNKQELVNSQIPKDTDIVHLHFQPLENIIGPHLITIHGNLPLQTSFYPNTSFLSMNHAKRYGADAFVYNGLNWNDYGRPDFKTKNIYTHFLGKAAWRIKNVKGAIKIAHRNKTEIKILGGARINLKMGPRVTFSKWARFYGMIGGKRKNELLKNSKGLIFPVLWHEPFGLAIIESLYFGCPVLGSKYGSLPEIISSEFGFLSNSMDELTEGFKNLESFDKKLCFEYAADNFNSRIMAENYLKLYEKVLNGEKINSKTPCFIETENKLPKFYV